jgi:hypothetical protein
MRRGNVIGRLVLYRNKPAVIVKTGEELTAHFQADNNDHLGLWFGEVDAEGKAIVYTIPAEHVTLESAPIAYEH